MDLWNRIWYQQIGVFRKFHFAFPVSPHQLLAAFYSLDVQDMGRKA